MIIRHGIRPCGKTPLDATLRLVEFQIIMISSLSRHAYVVIFFFSITFYATMAMDTHIALANTKCNLTE